MIWVVASVYLAIGVLLGSAIYRRTLAAFKEEETPWVWYDNAMIVVVVLAWPIILFILVYMADQRGFKQ